jgi:hypothetical protein
MAAGNGPAYAQDARAAEVLAATRKAIGGKALDSLKTLSVDATVQRNVGNFQAQSDVEIAVEVPDKFARTDVPSGAMGVSVTTGFNGDRAIVPANARVMPGGGAMVIMMGGPGAAPGAGHDAEKPSPEQLEEMNTSALRNSRHEISRLMLGWFGMTHPALHAKYTYAGEAESPDGKAHVIDVKDEDGFVARLFIDQRTRLPLMLTYQGRQPRVMRSTAERPPSREEADKRAAELKAAMSQPQPLVDITLFFDDWREVDGVKFPHTVRRASEGNTTEEWSVGKVKVNPKIDAKKFAVRTH